MARLEFTKLPRDHVASLRSDRQINPKSLKGVSRRIPQIFWSSHMPWQEANLWAYIRAGSGDVELDTIESNMRGLIHYAAFLEAADLTWHTFPALKADRCLVRYRGHLKREIKSERLAPSTASARMRHVILFYRWVQLNGLLQFDGPLWKDIPVHIKYFDPVGFERTMTKITTDISISNRKRHGERLEDGLLPVSIENRNAILRFADENACEELFLFLAIGFFSGIRLGTICDLKIQTLRNAVPDPASPRMFNLAVGPGASPAVRTKFAITGQVWITQELLELLRAYASSPRRLIRESKASFEDRNLLFLTRFGNPYARGGLEKSSAINVEMSKLRKAAKVAGLRALEHFRFHQSRCTFGTELARIALRVGDNISAIQFVRDAMLHKHEATTLKYIKFVERTPIKQAAANAFSEAFMGLAKL
jgi:integrase